MLLLVKHFFFAASNETVTGLLNYYRKVVQHLKGTNSRVVSRLGHEEPLVGAGWPFLLFQA